MHLGDVEHESAPRAEQYLSQIKVIRSIAHKIIAFLEQLENFQRRLWLKKKFVLETNYCITLDRVPETLYEEIAANDAQRAEWVRLFGIDSFTPDLTKAGYTNPLTLSFLKSYPTLPIDTAHFSTDFKDKLLAAIPNLDVAIEGLLVQATTFTPYACCPLGTGTAFIPCHRPAVQHWQRRVPLQRRLPAFLLAHDDSESPRGLPSSDGLGRDDLVYYRRPSS